jgi:hypothetical protein
MRCKSANTPQLAAARPSALRIGGIHSCSRDLGCDVGRCEAGVLAAQSTALCRRRHRRSQLFSPGSDECRLAERAFFQSQLTMIYR